MLKEIGGAVENCGALGGQFCCPFGLRHTGFGRGARDVCGARDTDRGDDRTGCGIADELVELALAPAAARAAAALAGANPYRALLEAVALRGGAAVEDAAAPAPGSSFAPASRAEAGASAEEGSP